MHMTSYLIALGSNRRHFRHGAPGGVIAAAEAVLTARGLRIVARAPVFVTSAIGPAGRSFANGALMIESPLDPGELIDLLKTVERDFGRRKGRRWGPRVLDLDIILWSEGCFAEDGICVPHPSFRSRSFVLDPLDKIAPGWRDPVSGRTIRQLRAQLRRAIPVDRRRPPE